MLVLRRASLLRSFVFRQVSFYNSDSSPPPAPKREPKFEASDYLKDRDQRRFQKSLTSKRVQTEQRANKDKIRHLFSRPYDRHSTMFNKDQGYRAKKQAADTNTALPEEKLEKFQRKLNYLRANKITGAGRYMDMLQGRRAKFKDGKFMISTQERAAYNHLSDVHILSSQIRALGLQRKLAVHLFKQGFVKYSQMQKKAIPVVRTGRNCIITGMTGSGKTFSYLIPLVNKIMENQSHQHPLYLVIAPSEILVDQLIEVINTNFGALGVKAATVYEAMRHDQNSVKFRYLDFNFVVGTINSVYNKLGQHLLSVVDGVVLEEFDMLMKESMDTLEHLLSKGGLSSRVGMDNLQLIFVSATMMDEGSMMQLEDSVPKLAVVGHQTHLIPTNIYYKFEKVELHKKNRLLLDKLLPNIKAKKRVLVFANRATTCDFLVHYLLNELEYLGTRQQEQKPGTDQQRRAKSMYGSCVKEYLKTSCMPVVPIFAHKQATKHIKRFQEKEQLIAVATDVASRGIDFKNVDVVINYDFPRHMTQFLHRCGRMSRCNMEASKEKREEFVNKRRRLMRRIIERVRDPAGHEALKEQTVTNAPQEESELKVQQIDERKSCVSFVTFRSEKYTADLIMNKLYFKVPIYRFPTYDLKTAADPDNFFTDSTRVFSSLKKLRDAEEDNGQVAKGGKSPQRKTAADHDDSDGQAGNSGEEDDYEKVMAGQNYTYTDSNTRGRDRYDQSGYGDSNDRGGHGDRSRASRGRRDKKERLFRREAELLRSNDTDY